MAEQVSPDIAGWRLRKQRYRLIGEECQRCGTRKFPPGGACLTCHPGPEVYKFEPVYKPEDLINTIPVAVALIVV